MTPGTMQPAERATQDTKRETMARAFTLIEMLIVIAILLLLLGIGMALTGVLGTGERGLTQSILSQLEAINTEHKALTGSYVDSPNITELIEKTRASQNFEPFLGKIPAENFRRSRPTVNNDKTQYLVDAWDNPIVYVHPNFWNNVVQDVNGDTDLSDTSNPEIDMRYGPTPTVNGEPHGNHGRVPKRNVPYFASAGPDGKWGNHGHFERKRDPNDQPSTSGSPSESDLADQASDNLYSFDLEQ